MIKYTNIIFLTLFMILISSCNIKKENRNPKFLASIKIHIPEELVEYSEIVEFFESSEKAINEYSDNIEEFAFEGKDILEMDEESLSDTNRNKLSLMNIQFVSNSTRMVNVLEDAKKFIEVERKNGLDESQLRSLETIKEVLEKRIRNINIKYKDYFK